MRAWITAAALLALPADAQELPAGAYRLDPAHATLVFSVDHLGFSDFTATFDRFDAVLEIDPTEPEKASLQATIDVASLDLPSPPDGFLELLLSTPWFDATAHPEMTFASDQVRLTGEHDAEVGGLLTLRGVALPVSMQVAFNGGYEGHPMDPNARIGFSAEGSLSRSAFGMYEGVPPPDSTMGVGDLVRFAIEAELTGPAWEANPLQEK